MQDSQLSGTTRGGLSLHERAHDDRHQLLGYFSVEGAAGLALARRHAELMDALISAALVAALDAVDPKRRRPSFALAATGAFGRARLAWMSQLEVRFISGSPAKIRPIAEAMADLLRTAGISLAYQVATVSEAVQAAAVDAAVATRLLDLRLISGDASLVTQLRERADAEIFSGAQLASFLERLATDARTRHERFGGSVQLLEPEIKLGLGGLRDLDSARWAALARWRTSDPQALVQLGVISARDAENLAAASDFLWMLRNRIHLRMGSRSDRLSFKQQEGLAVAMADASVETLMSEYYRHARNIAHLSELILSRATQASESSAPARDLGGGLCATEHAIGLLEPQRLRAEPALALRLYTAALEHQLGVLESSRNVIAEQACLPEWAAALRQSHEANADFVRLVSNPRRSAFRSGSILSELHDVGLLLAMIPEFGPLVGRVHHDAYHVYTVDAYALAGVDRLRALLRGELAERHPLASRLAAEVTRPHVLFLASLLRDIGKACGREGHPLRGAALAHDILQRLGFTPADNASTCQLIREQLSMYFAAVRRDLEDPATIAEFTREGQSPESIRDLYLLTVIGVATISPSSLTKWRAGMLDALYLAADAELRAQDGARRPAQLAQLRKQLKSQWRDQSDAAALDEFIDGMPERYVLTSSAAEIIGHARVAQRLAARTISAGIVPSRAADVTELCVVTEINADPSLCVVSHDRPGLLAAITAAITAARLEIRTAQIYSRYLPNGSVQAVDLFWVRSARGPGSVTEALPKIELDLEQLITGRLAPARLFEHDSLGPYKPYQAAEVIIDQHASSRHTVIELMADDRPGLLFSVAQAFHELGVSVAAAKVQTESGRVSDTFYVNEFDGTKLDSETRIREVRTRILAVLSESARSR